MKKNWRNKTIGITHVTQRTGSSTSVLLVKCLVIFAALVFVSCNRNESAHEHDTYTCPMHPTVISDKPGTCPVCGMDLVRKARPGEEVKITEDLSKLMKSPNEAVVASVKTVKGEYKSMPVSIEVQGVVTYDTRNLYTISARIGGRLEKVFVKYAFQPIKKGQKLAEIYSPELLTAQRELLFLLENDRENSALIQGAKDRLRLLGATEAQINNLIEKKEPQNTFALYSPYNGYVIAENQQAPAAPLSSPKSSTAADGTMGDGMAPAASSSAMPNSPATPFDGETLIREGSYVSPGQTLFKIVNASAVRVELNAPSEAASVVKIGGKVMLDFGNDHQQPATIDFIQPFFNKGQEFITLRVYTKDNERLHIGHLVTAIAKGNTIEALWVPEQAVLDLGVNKVVFIKDKKVFKPKNVVIGIQTDNAIEIKQGLSSSDEIAANAQYLVDSESFIKIRK